MVLLLSPKNRLSIGSLKLSSFLLEKKQDKIYLRIIDKPVFSWPYIQRVACKKQTKKNTQFFSKVFRIFLRSHTKLTPM